MAGDPTDIANWLRIDARITSSGHIKASDVEKLAALGVRHIVNLALDDHPQALPDEAAQVAAAGMAYHHIPIPFDAPTDAHFHAFARVMTAASDEPVHVHCIVNARVSAMLYRWRRDIEGVPDAEAYAMMTRIWDPGLHPKGEPWARFTAPRPLDTPADSH